MIPPAPQRHHDLSSLGWFSGDGHQHLAPTPSPAEARTRVITWCAEQRMQWLYVCQPWLTQDVWMQTDELPAFPSAHKAGFNAWLGAELPKTRYGHTWWINLKRFVRPFRAYMDTRMEDFYVDPTAADHSAYPYQSVPMYHAWAEYLAQGAVPVHPHPTSWWTANNGSTFVTNISSLLPFYALAGLQPIVMVVLGYDADHIFYQSLWFHLLNHGFRITAAAESDGSITDARPRFLLGSFRTFAWVDPAEEFSSDALARAVAAGRTIASSGPFIHANISGNPGYSGPGTVMPADGAAHSLALNVLAAPLPDEHISHVLIYRNGVVFHHADLRAQRPRRWQATIPISERDDAWYVIKCYGAKGPASDDALDVMAFAERCANTGETPYAGDGQVALTSPFYFRRDPSQPDPQPLFCNATVRFTNAAPTRVSIIQADGHINQQELSNANDINCRLRLTDHLRLEFASGATVEKAILTDHPDVAAAIEHLYRGAWRATYPQAQPGQVPWSAFAFERLATAARAILWTI